MGAYTMNSYRTMFVSALILLISSCTVMQAMDTELNGLEDYKAILAGGDPTEIIKATNKAGLIVVVIADEGFSINTKYFMDKATSTFVPKIAAEQLEGYKQALYDFIMKDILYPAIDSSVPINEAFAKIDQLAAGKFNSWNQEYEWNGILGSGGVGMCVGTYQGETLSRVVLAMRLAICYARDIDPKKVGLGDYEKNYQGWMWKQAPKFVAQIREYGTRQEACFVQSLRTKRFLLVITALAAGILCIKKLCTRRTAESESSDKGESEGTQTVAPLDALKSA